MGSGIALDNAEIMSTVLEAILYGFSILMFTGTIWVLTHDEKRRGSSQMMIAVAVIFLVLSTTHTIVDIVRLDEGLVKYRNTFPGGPVAFFADISQWSYVTKNVIYLLQTLVGDAVVIYRCYVVWQSGWIIVIPSMLWCSVAVTGTGAVYASASQAIANASNVFSKETSGWFTVFFVSTLVCNMLSSGLLAYRIWTIERSVVCSRCSKSALIPALHAIVDAALLYSVALFVTLICFVTANNGEYVAVNLVNPIISIAFYLVLVRVSLRRANVTHYVERELTPQEAAHELHPLEVHISQFSSNDANPPYRPNSSQRNSRFGWFKPESGGAANEA